MCELEATAAESVIVDAFSAIPVAEVAFTDGVEKATGPWAAVASFVVWKEAPIPVVTAAVAEEPDPPCGFRALIT